MRIFFCSVITFLLTLFSAFGQTQFDKSIPIITFNAKIIGKDSVVIPYNESYDISEDSCTQIIRHGHYNFALRKFYGNFIDSKKDDSLLIIAQGNYTSDGLKDGEFILNDFDGKLLAKGSFKKGEFDGYWLFYYPCLILK